MIELIVNGQPMGKQRPKFSKFHTYTPKKTVQMETLIKELYIINKFPMLQGAIKAEIIAYFTIPKSTPKKYLADMISGKTYYTKKSDADNIAKIVLDSINGIAYKDDAQVSILEVKKYYSEIPRVVIRLSEIN